MRKTERPNYDILIKDIEELGFRIGKKYGVSDNCIKKWKIYYENNKFVTMVE
jgi:hypothetical protein